MTLPPHDQLANDKLMQELWHPVVGWELRYEVSNTGKVHSLPYETPNPNGGGNHIRGGCVLKPRLQKHGYLTVMLRDKGRNSCRTVHSLVAQAFLPPCPGPIGRSRGCWQVDHIDKDKTNNAVLNLRWLPREENLRRATTNLTEQTVRKIRQKRSNGATLKELAASYSKSEGAISLLCNHKTWEWVI